MLCYVMLCYVILPKYERKYIFAIRGESCQQSGKVQLLLTVDRKRDVSSGNSCRVFSQAHILTGVVRTDGLDHQRPRVVDLVLVAPPGEDRVVLTPADDWIRVANHVAR